MLPKLSILVRAVSAVLMMTALFFLTTANFWVYGLQKQKQVTSAVNSSPEEEGNSGTSVPNPVEEKNSNSLQNLSEYLHDGHHVMSHPVSIISFGNMHSCIKLPIHHPELLTPPPKAVV